MAAAVFTNEEDDKDSDDENDETALTLGRRTAARQPMCVGGTKAFLRNSTMSACGSFSLCHQQRPLAWRGGDCSHNRKRHRVRTCTTTLMDACGERAAQEI